MADHPGDTGSPSLPLGPGASGPAVADLQRRLAALGFTPELDGVFAQRTISAVESFQSLRGLVATGSCDGATWSAVVEAGFGLGDRVLYLARPMLRGDDVADLQRRLGGLGFDAGRIDGILGPDTDTALREFQRHSGLRPDGVCGPATLAQLARLGPRISSPAAVAGVRERERLRDTPRHLHERRILVAHAGGLDAIATALARTLSATGALATVVQHRDPSAIASEANALDAGKLRVTVTAGSSSTSRSVRGRAGAPSTARATSSPPAVGASPNCSPPSSPPPGSRSPNPGGCASPRSGRPACPPWSPTWGPPPRR